MNSLLKSPPKYPRPYTEAHLRAILVDAQMRLAGALTFTYGLSHDGEWSEVDRAEFDHELARVIVDLQQVYAELGESDE